MPVDMEGKYKARRLARSIAKDDQYKPTPEEYDMMYERAMAKRANRSPGILEKGDDPAAYDQMIERIRAKPAPAKDIAKKKTGGSIGYRSGGSVKSKSASSRGDGCATKGKTRGKMC
jgi:hypothetical protein